MKQFLKKHTLTLLFIVALSIPLTIQTFQPGFFVGDDGEWMIIRSSAFHEALRDGQIPVRYLGRLNHEFGYPVPTFLYPGYLYLTELLVITGFGFIDSIKIMFALTMVFSGIFAYLWLTKLFDKWPALMGALVYLYTPYHLADMYIRGSLGELLALAVVPFILWSIERKSILFSTIGLASLILSHNIMAALFLPLIVVYGFLRRKEQWKKRMLSLAIMLLLSLGLASFFWVPALVELSYTIFHQTKISDWQNYFASGERIGGLSIILLITSIIIFTGRKWFTSKKYFFKETEYIRLFTFFICIGVIAVFFSSSLSTPLWHVLPVSFIQFPFRFLSLEIPAVAFFSAYILSGLRHKILCIIYMVTILLALTINAYPYFVHIQPFDKGEGFYVTNQSTTTTRDEYMPIWVKEKPLQRVDKKVEIGRGDGQVSNIFVNNRKITFSLIATSNVEVQISKIYWPGWSATIDGKKAPISYANAKGLMTISVPKGNHAVQLFFQETPLRLFSDGISILALLLLLGISFAKYRKFKYL